MYKKIYRLQILLLLILSLFLLSSSKEIKADECDLAPETKWAQWYFDNRDLQMTDTPLKFECPDNLNFQWGDGKHDNHEFPFYTPENLFSSTFYKLTFFKKGYYKFTALVDDGIRVKAFDISDLGVQPLSKVGGQSLTQKSFYTALNSGDSQGPLTLIDSWHGNNGKTPLSSKPTWFFGYYVIQVDYYNNGGSAKLALSYDKTDELPYELKNSDIKENDWVIEHYNNPNLNGNPDGFPSNTKYLGKADLSVNWGANKPDSTSAGFPNERYSSRYTTLLKPDTSSNYYFYAVADDGVRIFVDGEKVIDAWNGNNSTSYQSKPVVLGAGSHKIVAEHYNDQGLGSVKVWWKKTTDTASNLSLSKDKWLVEYFGNYHFNGKEVRYEYDANLDSITKDWSANQPDGLPRQKYSVRWSRIIDVVDPNGNLYKLTTKADDELKVLVDGETIQDVRTNNSPYYNYLFIPQGQHVLSLEYSENAGRSYVTYKMQLQP